MKAMGKKLTSLVLAMLMTMAMTVTAFAADPTIQVNDTENNQYTVYQVMTSVVSGQDSDGNDVYTYTVADNFKGFFEGGANGYTLDSDNQILDAMGSVIAGDGLTENTNSSVTAELASALAKYARENSISGTAIDANASQSFATGYYVVAETTTVSGIASKPILIDLRDDTQVNPKDSSVDLEKKIEEGGQLVDANNASIGDSIKYQVTSNIPVYEANVDKSKLVYTFTDEFTNISYTGDVAVTVGTTDLEEVEDYTTSITADGFTLSLNADTIFDHQGETVTLTYTGILLNTAAVDSTTGNPNKIKLTYTNNPNVENSTGTLEDEVTTYTYGFKLHKVDKNDNNKDMAGAQFTIKNSKGTVIAKFAYGEDGAITTLTEGVSADSKIIVTTDGAGVKNYAVIKGLDAGEYTITETAAPQGYSLLGSDVKVTISDDDLDGKAAIAVSGQGTTESDLTDNGNGTIDLTVKVENVKGISLPETGSKTMMYCFLGGAAMIVLGGLYFAVTRRKRKNA